MSARNNHVQKGLKMGVFNKGCKEEKNHAAENKEVNTSAAEEAAKAAQEEEKKEDAGEMKEEAKKELTAEEKIAELEKTVAELTDKRIRLIAEMENQRKRAAKDLESMRFNVMADTLYPFFQVFDHFEMAVAACEKSDNIQALTAGMQMIGNEFARAFDDLGITKIDAVGKDFDANDHDAVAQEASDTVPEGKVIRQWCAGYRTKDRLLKAASVVVSSGPAKKEETEGKAEAEESASATEEKKEE